MALLTLWAPPAHAEGDFAEHVERASQLSKDDRFDEALKELEAAYAIKQPASLLYSLGRAHRRLGHSREALDFYQRFLAAESDPNPEMKTQVEKEVGELRTIMTMTGQGGQAVTVRPPAEDPERPPLANPYALGSVPVRFEVHHDRGLIGGGIGLFASSYAAAMITGSIFLSFGGGAQTGVLLIPILGPVISGFLVLSPVWSVPWILVDAAAQAAGLAMIIVGARTKQKVPVWGDRLRVSPFSLASGGGLMLTGRF